MAYTPKTWNDGPSGATPVTAADLNHIEQGIASAAPAVGSVVGQTGSVTGAQIAADSALKAAFGRVVTPEKYGAVGDDTADDTAALQAAINAAQGAQNGIVLLAGKYKVTDTLSVSRPVTIRGSHRSTAQIRQVTAAKNGITLVRDVSTGQSFTRGVRIEGVTLLGPGNGTSTAYGIGGVSGDEIYQGQSLNLKGVTLSGWDIGLRLHRWDNGRYEALGLESCRVGLHIDGNANSHYINASATTCTEAVIRLGDGLGTVLDLNDLINSGQMLDMLTGSQAYVMGANFESCTGSQAFVHVANGAYLFGSVGRCIKGGGNDIPLFLVENGGALSVVGHPTYAGFTTSKPIRKANNSATVQVLGPTTNLGAAPQALVDDVGLMSYAASPWPVRQENAIPAAGVNLRNMIVAALNRDTSGSLDKLYYYGADRTTGSTTYQRWLMTGTLEGAGSPEGVVTASPGTRYVNTSGGSGTTFYVKESGTGSTGWSAGASGPTGPSGAGRADLAYGIQGWISQNYPLLLASGGAALTAGTIFGYPVGLTAGDVVTSIGWGVTTAGAGTVPTGMYVGLADSTGTMVAQSSNLASSSIWTAAGVASAALSSPYTVTTTGGYIAMILQVGSWGTTQAAFARVITAASALAVPMSGKISPSGSFGTAQTALPANGSALPSLTGSSNTAYWCGTK